MPPTAKRRIAIGIVVSVAILALINVLVFVAPPAGSPFRVLAVMLGIVASLAIWGVALSAIRKRRSHALAFAFFIPAVLLLPSPFREATLTEWPTLVGVAAVCSALMTRWVGPTRRYFESQDSATPLH